jgi:YfiH family protein
VIEPIVPDWPAPANVRALATTRLGGASEGPYASLNLGAHVGDAEAAVAANRRELRRLLPADPLWLNQVHGTRCVAAETASPGADADASFTRMPGAVCAVLTADCLPVLLCDAAGTAVAAVHAGWRGLAAGVIDSAVTALGVPARELIAWLGPAIGPEAYEVDEDVRAAFAAGDPVTAAAFHPRGDKWLCDLYALARRRLAALGVERVFGGDLCTFSDSRRFYSYRRDGRTGRMATLIWLE